MTMLHAGLVERERGCVSYWPGDHVLCGSSRQRDRGCVLVTTLRAGLVGSERGCVSLTGDHALCGSSR